MPVSSTDCAAMTHWRRLIADLTWCGTEATVSYYCRCASFNGLFGGLMQTSQIWGNLLSCLVVVLFLALQPRILVDASVRRRMRVLLTSAVGLRQRFSKTSETTAIEYSAIPETPEEPRPDSQSWIRVFSLDPVSRRSRVSPATRRRASVDD